MLWRCSLAPAVLAHTIVKSRLPWPPVFVRACGARPKWNAGPLQILRPSKKAKAKGVRVGNVSDYEAGKMQEVTVGEQKVLLVRVRLAQACGCFRAQVLSVCVLAHCLD